MTEETNSRAKDDANGESLYVLPLVSAVLFPHSILSIQITTGPSFDALSEIPEDVGEVVVVVRPGSGDLPDRAVDEPKIGVRARLLQRIAIGNDRFKVVLQGSGRLVLRALREDEKGRAVARVAPVPVAADGAGRADLLSEKVIFFLEELIELDGRYSDDAVGVARSCADGDVDEFADRVASYLQVGLPEKRVLIETVDPVERLRKLLAHLQHDVERATIDRDVERQAKLSMSLRDRQRYLRDQMLAIQDELGEAPVESETDEYTARIDLLPLEDDWKQMLRREVQRMGQLMPGSSDYSVIRGHLDTILQMPWDQTTPDQLDLKEAEELLNHKHHGLKEVKERVLEFLAVVKLKGDLRGPILCFAGPPGVGKTSLGESIADALGRKFIRLSVGGMTDESEIRGHRKTYVGAMPGKIVNGYLQAGVRNPLIMIDEIDKVGKDFRGDPASSLLEVLDPEQNARFVDRYLEIPFDLSQTLFLVTANVLDEIPSPLRDRLEIIRLAGYAENEKLQIAKRHLVPKILGEHGLTDERVAFEDDAMLSIIREYTAEAGVRELSRKVAAVARKAARAVASGSDADVHVSRRNLRDYLGMPVYEHEFAQRAPEVGVATGLAWTSVGGEILFIEATRMEGTGKTIVTGHLGDVMKESVQTAYSYVRSRARELGVPDGSFESSDLHVHFPAGAIPKDGPSAGVAVATTIASLMAERPILHDVAMTGEITLRGKLLSVGGIKEKIIAARRAEIKRIILPMGNRKDLAEVADEVKADLEFVFAERVEDVWKEAMIPLSIVNHGKRRKYDEAEFAAEKARGAAQEQP